MRNIDKKLSDLEIKILKTIFESYALSYTEIEDIYLEKRSFDYAIMKVEMILSLKC